MAPNKNTRVNLAVDFQQKIIIGANDYSCFVEEVLGNLETALVTREEVKISTFTTFVNRQK